MPRKPTKRQREIALQYAIRWGRIDEVERLLAEGIDPNALGEQPCGFKYAFTLLIEAVIGAGDEFDPTTIALPNSNNASSPDSSQAMSKRNRALEIINLLLAAGADPSRPSYSRTPLSLACEKGDLEVVQILLQAGANPSGKCWSPLSELPKPKGSLPFYCNAIHFAAWNCRLEILKLLIAHGADITARDHKGETPLDIARENHNAEGVEVLTRQLAAAEARTVHSLPKSFL